MARIFLYEALSAEAPDIALDQGTAGYGELLAAGRDMRDAIAADLARIAGVDTSVAVGVQEARHATPNLAAVAPITGEGALDFVRRQADLHDLCWVVAPESGGLLLRLHEAVGDARWIGCSADAIRVTSSKRATCAVLERAGIVTPRSFTDGYHGPWIVKPDDGAGALETRRHATRDAAAADLEGRLYAARVAVAEPLVTGEALSISLVAGPELALAVAFNRQRIEIDDHGFLHDLGVQPAAIDPDDPRVPTLQALAARVAAALPGLRGYVGIDLVWNERAGPVVIEVNPRVTCAYVGLSALLRRNLAADILAAHPRGPVREPADVAA